MRSERHPCSLLGLKRETDLVVSGLSQGIHLHRHQVFRPGGLLEFIREPQARFPEDLLYHKPIVRSPLKH